jgi:type III secretion protein N (ATPase)
MTEIVGFADGEVLLSALGDPAGLGPGDPIESTGAPLSLQVSTEALGRVLDGLGRPIDGRPAYKGKTTLVDRLAPSPLGRPLMSKVLETGVRAIDGLCAIGEGQRLGIFAGSGVGKSTLLTMIARGTSADVVVLALVGERGREVAEALDDLDNETRKRCVVVVATGDEPALLRVRAAQTAMAIAESLRDDGKRVLLLLDSITRFARACREVGLASGEPPTRRGYPPSVFAALPRLVERAGLTATGSITAVLTVLVEGNDLEEPIADEIRGLLDGHIVLDRAVAAAGRYPAIDPLASLSRVMNRVTEPAHQQAAQRMHTRLAALASRRDLIALGAYRKGAEPAVDEALQHLPAIESFLAQPPNERSRLRDTIERLVAM